jgi:hypothetical protein
MYVRIQADDGDQLFVSLDDMALEQAIVRLMLENRAFPSLAEFDSVSLSAVQARKLGNALILAANILDSTVHSQERVAA